MAPAGPNIEVGGICFESPTMTTDRPRPIAPIASGTRIWDASSNTTTSKSTASAGRNRATDVGLMRKHGVTCVTRDPKRCSSWRTERPPRLRPSC
ncbi:Uncharacterised protein [Mycobacteroides abscessus]|nr:Uncharacterised protein [Mycobacteroides abscessus]